MRRVVFLGTPPIAATCLDRLLAAAAVQGFEVAGVVTQPPQPAGRRMRKTPSAVQLRAEASQCPVLTPHSPGDPDFLAAIGALRPDLCITAAYGSKLPAAFLDIPRLGTLNIHPSLLPKYRGPAPVQRALEVGERHTGVTVARTVLAMDAGPVLRQVERRLEGDERSTELLPELFDLGTSQLLNALPAVWSGAWLSELVEQEHTAASHAPKISRQEAKLDLETTTAQEVHNRARGFSDWPGVWCLLQIGGQPGVRAKLNRTRLATTGEATEGSQRIELSVNGFLEFVCGDGTRFEVEELTLPGKKPVGAKDFWNGLNGREVVWL